MTAINGTKPSPTRDEIKARRRRVREQLELQKIEQLESILWDGFGGSDLWFAMRERYGGGASGTEWVPISNTSDRKKGQNWPLWRTEVELGELRQKSRIVCQSNDAAICLLGNLQNHIVGKGFTYKCQPKKGLDQSPEAGVQAGAGVDQIVNATQAFVDKFLAVNRWTATINPSLLTSPGVGSRERETVRRTYRDGETFLRLFQADGGMTYVRFVEPEQVTQNGGANLQESEGWSFGIQHAMEPFEDEERRVAYHVQYKSFDSGEGAQGEIVPAAEMVHVKLPDEDAAIKRGTPAFSFDTLDAFVRGSKGQRNLSIAASIQAATAEMWKHQVGTVQQITSIAQGLSQRQYDDPISGKTKYVDKIDPGSIRRIPAGMEPVPMNFATGSKQEFIAVWQGDYRAGSRAFQAPEYFTGDASNANYSSTKEAGTPWVIASEVIQTHFGAVFAFVVWKAIAYAIQCGLLPPQALQVVELQVEPTAVPPTDPLQAAQENQIYVSTKIKSRKTAQMELGLDPDHEDANIEEDEQRFGMGAGGNPLAAMMGGDDGGGAPGGARAPSFPGGNQLAESFDEGDHPRASDGRFGSKAGDHAHAQSRSAKTSEQHAAASEAHADAAMHHRTASRNTTGDEQKRHLQTAAEHERFFRYHADRAANVDAPKKVETWASYVSKIPAKVYSAVKEKVQSRHAALKERYGDGMAMAIMGAGIAGLPIPVPGSSLITAAPVIVAAELVRAFKGALAQDTKFGSIQESDEPQLTPDEIEQLGKQFIAELLKDCGVDVTESLLESFTGIDANGHKWVNGKQVPIDATTTDDHADTLKALHAASITPQHDPQHVKDVVAKMAATLPTLQLKEVAKKFGINNTGASKVAIADAIHRKIVDRREMFQRTQR